jgi:hypothetical protein
VLVQGLRRSALGRSEGLKEEGTGASLPAAISYYTITMGTLRLQDQAGLALGIEDSTPRSFTGVAERIRQPMPGGAEQDRGSRRNPEGALYPERHSQGRPS